MLALAVAAQLLYYTFVRHVLTAWRQATSIGDMTWPRHCPHYRLLTFTRLFKLPSSTVAIPAQFPILPGKVQASFNSC